MCACVCVCVCVGGGGGLKPPQPLPLRGPCDKLNMLAFDTVLLHSNLIKILTIKIIEWYSNRQNSIELWVKGMKSL